MTVLREKKNLYLYRFNPTSCSVEEKKKTETQQSNLNFQLKPKSSIKKKKRMVGKKKKGEKGCKKKKTVFLFLFFSVGHRDGNRERDKRIIKEMEENGKKKAEEERAAQGSRAIAHKVYRVTGHADYFGEFRGTAEKKKEDRLIGCIHPAKSFLRVSKRRGSFFFYSG